MEKAQPGDGKGLGVPLKGSWTWNLQEEAKAAIEDYLGKVLGRTSLSGVDRTEVGEELQSGYYEGAESKAKEHGDAMVTLADVNRMLAGEGAPEQVAACYMKSYAGSLRRAGILSRTIAYVIDGLTRWGTAMLAVPVALVLFQVGDHVAGLMVAVVILVMLTGFLTAVGFVVCYTIVLEGHFGQTLGKYVLGLKVLKADGTKIGYREAILRNIPKYVGNFIVIDALIMLVFFNKDKQRAFDKVADTIVVHIH